MVSTVFLELTNYCNMNCDFCSNNLMTRSKGFMSVDLAKQIIEQLKQMGFNGSLITSLMGEPLMHKNFIEILKYSIENGIKTNVITNYSLVPERISIKELLNAGIETLCLSYQTPDKDTFKTRRIKISFEDYFEKLKEILIFANNKKINTKRIEIYILQSLHNYLNVEIVNNYDLIESAIINLQKILYFDLGNSKHSDFNKRITKNAIRKFKRGNQYQDEYKIQIAPKIHAVLKRANTWANCLLPEGCEVESQSKGHCRFFESSLGILWDGKCTVCCQDYNGAINIGNVKYSPIKDILESKTLMNMRKMEKKGQLINAYCQRCRGVIRKNGKKYSIIKNHGIIDSGLQLANRVHNKFFEINHKFQHLSFLTKPTNENLSNKNCR